MCSEVGIHYRSINELTDELPSACPLYSNIVSFCSNTNDVWRNEFIIYGSNGSVFLKRQDQSVWVSLATKSDLADYIKKKDFEGSNTYNFFNFRVYCNIGKFYGLLIIDKDNDFGLFFANFYEGQWNMINKLGGNLDVSGTNTQGTVAFIQNVTDYHYRLISLE